MAREIYSAVLEPSGGGWGITFPLFPGCVSFGQSAREAKHNAVEALELHLAGMVEDGEIIPVEDEHDDEVRIHASGGAGGDAIPVWIAVELPEGGNERVNVYLPKRLIHLVDRYASGRGMNRSSVFGLSLQRFLNAEAAATPAEREKSVD
jgi:predicted RNase H-like HicB family nuclease